MEAIKATGNNLLAALDTHDSVGVLDKFFPHADFFTEFERFDRHCEKLRRIGTTIDYLSVCSPNYLHDAHIRFGLRLGANVICEKPVVLNPWNVDALADMEKEKGKKVFTILQLRHHPAIKALRKKVKASSNEKFTIRLEYITPRGNWYLNSWKGNPDKSGGIATNIGLHFFDMLLWIFGSVRNNVVYEHLPSRASGKLELERADVEWKLSIEESMMPAAAVKAGKSSYRSLVINGETVEFSDGFGDLHREAYHEILAGNGFGLEETRAGIQLVHDIRNFKRS